MFERSTTPCRRSSSRARASSRSAPSGSSIGMEAKPRNRPGRFAMRSAYASFTMRARQRQYQRRVAADVPRHRWPADVSAWHGRPTGRWPTVWLLFFLLGFVLFTIAAFPASSLRILTNTQRADGTIDEVLPQSHGSVRVVYLVSGTSYLTSGPYRPIGPQSEPRIGQHVTVYYESGQPQNAQLIDPRRGITEGLSSGIVLSALLATLVTWLFVAPPRR